MPLAGRAPGGAAPGVYDENVVGYNKRRDRYCDGLLMKRILIVKVTSLGDIVEALPVIAEIKQAFPGVQVDWAADEAFAEVVHWSQRVDRVL